MLRTAALLTAALALGSLSSRCRADQTAGSAPAAPPKPWYEAITFKGYVQLDAIFPEGNSTQGGVSNFRIRRARPTFVAQLDPLTRVQVQFDLSTGKAGAGAATASVTDTFAERKVPGFGYAAFGQMVLPFGHEVHEDNAALRSPLELSYAAEQLALAERDIGVFLRTSAPEESPVHWELAFVNGQGFRTADANANKTFIGRVVTTPHKFLRVGASTILGTYRAGTTDYDRHALGLEFRSDITKAINLEGEFYNVRFVDSVTAPTRAVRYNGGYLMFESWIGPLKSIPFLRYQRTYGDLDYRSFDLGWRYQYTPTQRLTLEYDIVNGHQRNMFGARWQLAF